MADPVIKAISDVVDETTKLLWPAWTQDKPSVAGWYWYRKYPRDHSKCVLVYWEDLSLSGRTLMYDGWPVKMHIGEWSGPIMEPTDTKS